jgi:hypothetical protein
MAPILSQMNSIHKLTSCFLNVHLNIFSSMPMFSKWSLTFRFSDNFYVFLVSEAC